MRGDNQQPQALGSGVRLKSEQAAAWGPKFASERDIPAYKSDLATLLGEGNSIKLARIEVTPEVTRTMLDFDPDDTWNEAAEQRGPTNVDMPQAGLFDDVRNYWQGKKDSAVNERGFGVRSCLLPIGRSA
jgi:hypothetical protein